MVIDVIVLLVIPVLFDIRVDHFCVLSFCQIRLVYTQPGLREWKISCSHTVEVSCFLLMTITGFKN